MKPTSFGVLAIIQWRVVCQTEPKLQTFYLGQANKEDGFGFKVQKARNFYLK
jgi:hypothetical protein